MRLVLNTEVLMLNDETTGKSCDRRPWFFPKHCFSPFWTTQPIKHFPAPLFVIVAEGEKHGPPARHEKISAKVEVNRRCVAPY